MSAPILDNHQLSVSEKGEAIVLMTTVIGDEKNVLWELKQLDTLTEAYIVHGSYDILARFKTEDSDSLTELLNIRIRNIKGIKRTRNLILI